MPRSIIYFWIANMSLSCWNRLMNIQKNIIYLSMRKMIKNCQGLKSVHVHVERSLLILSHRPICVLA